MATSEVLRCCVSGSAYACNCVHVWAVFVHYCTPDVCVLASTDEPYVCDCLIHVWLRQKFCVVVCLVVHMPVPACTCGQFSCIVALLMCVLASTDEPYV